jgi:hypothetical protein
METRQVNPGVQVQGGRPGISGKDAAGKNLQVVGSVERWT